MAGKNLGPLEDAIRKMMEEMGRNPPPPFKPHAVYNPPGRQLEVWWDDEMCYAKPLIGTGLVLHHARSDDRVVGVTVHDPKRLVEEGEESDRNSDYYTIQAMAPPDHEFQREDPNRSNEESV